MSGARKFGDKEYPMLRYAFLSLLGLVSGTALAQQAPPPEGTPVTSISPASVQPSKAVISLEERLPGDHWTVEVRDEITGAVSTQTDVVTKVTPTDISVRFNIVRADKTTGEGFGIYDRSWNFLRDGRWQHFPYEGSTGIQAPLTVGKTWTFQSKAVNAETGVTWNRSGTSKVVGQETVTTKAGTFETFRIETTTLIRDSRDPTSIEELTLRTWYAPAIAHWVKRFWIVRRDKHLMSNNTYELVEFARKS
jgi:hypothetical protein